MNWYKKAQIESVRSLDDLLEKLRQKYNGLIISVNEQPHRITIEKIEVPTDIRGQGIGTKVINDIKNYALNIGKPVVLYPSYSKGKKEELYRFYERLGFYPIPDKKRYQENSPLFSPSSKEWYWSKNELV